MRVRVFLQLLFKTIAVVYNNIGINQVLEFLFALAYYGCYTPFLLVAIAAGVLHIVAIHGKPLALFKRHVIPGRKAAQGNKQRSQR